MAADILDVALTAWSLGNLGETNRLLSLARERIAAGDECARHLAHAQFGALGPYNSYVRHAAAVKACEEEVGK